MQAKRITEGAICLAIYIILLLLVLYLPVFGVVLSFVLPLPFAYFTAKYQWKNGLVLFVGAVILTFLFGTITVIPVTLLYGIVGIVLGWCIHERKGQFITFSVTTLTFLFCSVLIYIASVLFFNMNIIEELFVMVEETFQQTFQLMEQLGQETAELETFFQEFKQLFITLLPTLLIMSSALMVVIIQQITYRILQRFGIPIVEAIPFRELTLPKSLIWYYLIFNLLYFVMPGEPVTFLHSVYMNGTYILQILFVLQGITFLFFYTYHKKMSKALPIIAIVLTLFFPLFNQLVLLLGIVDLGFGLRKRVEKTN